jgi:3',5'-cyclic AMP phosphodiesterase CpdA
MLARSWCGRVPGDFQGEFMIRAFVVCWLAWMSVPAWAHDGEHEPPPRVPDARLYEPTAMPDRVVLTWTGDPTTTQAVTWRTSTEVSRAYAEIAVAEAGPRFSGQARRVDARTRVFRSELSKCHAHTAEFTGLNPDVKYAYRVGDGVNWSEWFHFRTAPAKPQAFSFIYFGDAQNDVRSLWSRVIREAFSDAPRAAFALHAGDLIDSAEHDGQWGEWFGAGAWINAMLPVIAVPGNHEYISEKKQDGSRVQRLSRHWAAQFAFPDNGPEGLKDSVYYIDYQNIRVIALNSNELHAEQIPWIDETLSTSEKTWNIVTFHHPIFSMAKDRDNPKLRELWKPVLDRHQVDLVLTGHDHTYGRTGLLVPDTNVATGANWRSAPAGTVYVVSVSGPKLYEFGTPMVDVLRKAEDTQLYQIITVDGDSLTYVARTATGEQYDGFTLNKRKGQPNEMIERIPSTPERLRRAG